MGIKSILGGGQKAYFWGEQFEIFLGGVAVLNFFSRFAGNKNCTPKAKILCPPLIMRLIDFRIEINWFE